jgi:hypothetical protein
LDYRIADVVTSQGADYRSCDCTAGACPSLARIRSRLAIALSVIDNNDSRSGASARTEHSSYDSAGPPLPGLLEILAPPERASDERGTGQCDH